MAINVECEGCGTLYSVDDEMAGQTARCTQCGREFLVPDLPEVSASGAPIYRHEEREEEFEPPQGDPDALEHIDAHIEEHIGEVETVFHEIVSDIVHLDVHWIAPTPDRDFHTLITTGMSDLPMTVPEGAEDYRHAELLIALPSEWPLSQEAFEDERHYWPIRWLKTLARLPHEYGTWLGFGHTVPHGDPVEPFAPNTEMCCWLIGTPMLTPEAFDELRVSDDKTIHFLAIYPLYEEEMQLKLDHGFDALAERLEAAGVTELLDIGRTNTCKRRSGLL